MRIDRKLGATAIVGNGLHPSAFFAPHATVACFASHLRSHYSESHFSVRRVCRRAILIGRAPIRNQRISLKQHAMPFSNRSKRAGLRPRFSKVLHATKHEEHRASHAFLIATQILGIALTHSQQTRKHFLIATIFALSHMLGTPTLTSLDSPAALTALHPSPTMKTVPCILQRITHRVAAVADHGPLITNHHSLITGYQNV